MAEMGEKLGLGAEGEASQVNFSCLDVLCLFSADTIFSRLVFSLLTLFSTDNTDPLVSGSLHQLMSASELPRRRKCVIVSAAEKFYRDLSILMLHLNTHK